MHVQSDTILLDDASGNFRDTSFELYELYPAQYLTAPMLAWQAVLKKTKTNLNKLTNTHMLLMVGKSIRDGMFHAIPDMKANNKYMKNYAKDKKP